MNDAYDNVIFCFDRDLGWNSLTGPIPQALRDREKKGLKLT